MFGVKKEVPFDNRVPAVAAVYQLTVPAEGVAARITDPESHRVAGVALVIVGAVLTVAVTAVRDRLGQPLLIASA